MKYKANLIKILAIYVQFPVLIVELKVCRILSLCKGDEGTAGGGGFLFGLEVSLKG
jgi:hypothetical protein